MPSAILRIKTLTQLDNHSVELQTKANRVQAIYNCLQSYDYTNSGGSYPMPDFDWAIPTNGVSIRYRNSIGEIEYNYNPYSSLSPQDRIVFWKWIDKFIVQCLKNYDINYNL
jgi:hypothetical protein